MAHAENKPFKEFFAMKIQLCTVMSIAIFGMCACSDDSNPTASGSASGRIDAALVGTWVENPAAFAGPDTLIFAENKIQVPFFSAVGTQFSAKDGLVKGGPSMSTYGEYI